MTQITPQEAIDLLRGYYKDRDNAIHVAKVNFNNQCKVLQDNENSIDWPHKVGNIIKVRTMAYTNKSMLITRRGVVQHPVMHTQIVGYEGFILKKDNTPSKKKHTVPMIHYLEEEKDL